MPPPSVRPPTPVPETTPAGTTAVRRSWPGRGRQAWPRRRRSRCASRGPRRRRRIVRRSMTRPPSTVPLPATLWPPPRIASGRAWSRAKPMPSDDVVGARHLDDDDAAGGRSSRSTPSGPRPTRGRRGARRDHRGRANVARQRGRSMSGRRASCSSVLGRPSVNHGRRPERTSPMGASVPAPCGIHRECATMPRSPIGSRRARTT